MYSLGCSKITSYCMICSTWSGPFSPCRRGGLWQVSSQWTQLINTLARCIVSRLSWGITISCVVFTLIRRGLSCGGSGKGKKCALSLNCTSGKCLLNHLLFQYHSGIKAVLKFYSSTTLKGFLVFCGAALSFQFSCEYFWKLAVCSMNCNFTF